MGKYLHPKAMAFVIFLLDIIYGCFNEAISFFPPRRETAIASIVLFSVIGGLVLIPVAVVIFLKYLEKSSISAIALWLVQLILAACYFYGKNINGILLYYGTHLGCYENCQETNQYIALFFLVLSILFVTYVIPEVHAMAKKKCDTEHHTYWCYFFGVILIFVSANAIYTTLSVIPVDIHCSVHAVALSSLVLCVVTIIAWYNIWAEFGTEEKETCNDASDHQKCSHHLFNFFTYVSLAGTLPLYLLSDNPLPLRYISCHNHNITFGGMEYNGTFDDSMEFQLGGGADHLARLIGMLTTVVVALCLFRKYCKDEKSKESHDLNII